MAGKDYWDGKRKPICGYWFWYRRIHGYERGIGRISRLKCVSRVKGHRTIGLTYPTGLIGLDGASSIRQRSCVSIYIYYCSIYSFLLSSCYKQIMDVYIRNKFSIKVFE